MVEIVSGCLHLGAFLAATGVWIILPYLSPYEIVCAENVRILSTICHLQPPHPLTKIQFNSIQFYSNQIYHSDSITLPSLRFLNLCLPFHATPIPSLLLFIYTIFNFINYLLTYQTNIHQNLFLLFLPQMHNIIYFFHLLNVITVPFFGIFNYIRNISFFCIIISREVNVLYHPEPLSFY